MLRAHDASASGGRGDHDIDIDTTNSRAAAYRRGELTPTSAAVLIGLVPREAGMHVILTERAAHLKDHAGQISFPGGRCEDRDEDAVATALRETTEEIGLARTHVKVIGRLDDYFTVTGYRVAPIVGMVTPGFALDPDAVEVAEVFEVPLDFLMTRTNIKCETAFRKGRKRRWYAISYKNRYIWGATAGMLVNLGEILGEL